MLFPNGLSYYALNLLARISLRDVVLARNKYLIVTSDVLVPQNNGFKRTYCLCRTVCTAIVMEKDTMSHALIF